MKERNSGEMTGNCCDPPPLRKPSHHVVRPYRSLRESERDCAVEAKRGRDESTEGKNVRFKSGWWDFIMLSERGDISVMLCSSLWHFKLIKASNNYAD